MLSPCIVNAFIGCYSKSRGEYGTMLNSRAIKVLNKLYEEEGFVVIHDLALLTKSSVRAVRYNLQKIDEFLGKKQLPYLKRHHLKGVQLVLDQKGKQVLADFFAETNPYNTILAKEEIHLFITLNLLINQREMPISYFEQSLNVSRTLVNNVINELYEFFESKKMQIHKIAKKGVFVTGDEYARMQEFVDLFCNHLSVSEFYHYIEIGTASSKLGNLLLKHLFRKQDLTFFKKLILSVEDELKVIYDDKSFLMLTFYFTRLVNGSGIKQEISNYTVGTLEAKDQKVYQVSSMILQRMQDTYSFLEIDDYEVLNLMKILLSIKTIQTSSKGLESYSVISEGLINRVEKVYQLAFSDRRDELNKLLLCHIEPMMHRIRFHLKLENPLFDEVTNMHKELFLNLCKACRELGELYSIDINEQEVSYLTLHFASIMDSIQEHTKLPKILVVCIEGVAISKYLATSISKLFNIREIDTMPLRQINQTIVNDYELIVTTVNLPELNQNKIALVNSILTEEDIVKLKDKLHLTYNRDIQNNVALVDQLVKVIQESCTISDLYKLKYDLLIELLNKDTEKSLQKNLGLRFQFSKKFVKVKQQALNWEEAINRGVAILYENGCVDPRYGKKIISNLREFGPYMSIAPGVVLPHAGPEDGVYENSMSIVVLEKGVDFHDRFAQPVQLIITLALKDGNGYLNVVERLIHLSNNHDFIQKVMKMNKPQQVAELFIDKLNVID
jgi:mannitol operon transcriptional antiterminator